MTKINRKYIDSHWLIFLIQGIISVIFGWITLFNSGNNLTATITFAGIYLLALSIIEFINALHRAKEKSGWIVSICVGLIDIIAALLVIFNISTDFNENVLIHFYTLAVYTLLRSIFEILIGFRTAIDPTDRFIWVLTGICGIVMGFAILNAGNQEISNFIRFFGAYLLVFGISSLIYSIDNRKQMLEDKLDRKKTKKTKKQKTTRKK